MNRPRLLGTASLRATLEDLEPSSTALFRERWARKGNTPRRRELSDEQTLRDAELLVEGNQVSYAALILFGKERL
jgi:ATP-dependent DNA helicase RecG